MNVKDFIPECYIDTNLVETLLQVNGYNINGVNHQKGCNTVVCTMQKNYNDSFALGIIDADKRHPQYVTECKEIASSQNITLLKHSHKHHFIILVKPAMDTLILSAAEELQVELSDYNLPSELKNFTNITKRVNSKEDKTFKRLFKKLRESKEMTILAEILVYLKEHRYDYDIQQLKNIFL